MQTGTPEEATASRTDRLSVATPADPAAPAAPPGVPQSDENQKKANPQPVDPGAPVMTGGGGPNEPDPSPWKGGTGEMGGPNEPDPSPWRGLETVKSSR